MTKIEEASAILLAAKNQALDLISGSEFATLGLTVRASMDTLINRLNFVAGNNHTPVDNVRDMFPPVTEVLGQSVEVVEPVTEVQLTPKQEQIKRFGEKVENLQNNINVLDNAKILEDYSSKEDQTVIRGVAKKAGIEDYKTREIDGSFLDEIRTGLEAQAEFSDKSKNAEETIKDASKDK